MTITQGTPLHGYSRGKTKTTQIVLHESVTTDRESAVQILKARDLSLHYTVERDGTIEQHLDIARAGAHAEGFGKPSLHNEASIGIEVCGIYYGHRLADAKVKRPDLYANATTISGVWVDRAWSSTKDAFSNPNRLYVVPTTVQLEATWGLVRMLWDVPGSLIPAAFPASEFDEDSVDFTWGSWTSHEGAAGIMAHHRWAHADALFVEHFCLARSLGYDVTEAYAVTLANASAMKRHTTIARGSEHARQA